MLIVGLRLLSYEKSCYKCLKTNPSSNIERRLHFIRNLLMKEQHIDLAERNKMDLDLTRVL
jgi:hypothetical protein